MVREKPPRAPNAALPTVLLAEMEVPTRVVQPTGLPVASSDEDLASDDENVEEQAEGDQGSGDEYDDGDPEAQDEDNEAENSDDENRPGRAIGMGRLREDAKDAPPPGLEIDEEDVYRLENLDSQTASMTTCSMSVRRTTTLPSTMLRQRTRPAPRT